MARKSNKRSVPGVLWRMFRHRARTLSDTVTSLLPPPPKLCRCDGRCCLGCTLDAKSFLLRSDDPSDYHRLLTQCFVVVSENAPSLPFFVPPSGLSQDQVLNRRNMKSKSQVEYKWQMRKSNRNEKWESWKCCYSSSCEIILAFGVKSVQSISCEKNPNIFLFRKVSLFSVYNREWYNLNMLNRYLRVHILKNQQVCPLKDEK